MEEKSYLLIDSEPSPLHFKRISPKVPLKRIVHGTQNVSKLTPNQTATTLTMTQTGQQRIDNQHSTARNSNITSIDLGPVLQRQCDLADLFVTQQKQVSLPTREIPL